MQEKKVGYLISPVDEAPSPLVLEADGPGPGLKPCDYSAARLGTTTKCLALLPYLGPRQTLLYALAKL